MSFFKRKEKNLIPPVQEQKPPPPGPTSSNYRTTPATYVASRDGDLYGTNSPSSNQGYPQTLNGTGGESLSRGRDDFNRDRQELLSGYNPENSRMNRFSDRPSGGGGDYRAEPAPGEEQEEDVEGIKQQIRTTKQESVNSTRNALRLAREAEETARGTLLKLGDQSEKLANTERHLDITKAHSHRAEDNTDELKKLNRSIFRPAITFNKDAKRSAHEMKIQARYEEEREERERGMRDIRDTQNRLGKAMTYGKDDEEGIGGAPGGNRFKSEAQLAARKEQRKRFQFDATASDDEMENEMEDNLDEISEAAKRLKALGTSMGQELENQKTRIDRIYDKADSADQQMFKNTEKLKRIK